MLMVCAEVALVEAELVGGLLGCPSCRGVLGPWGHARERVLRCRSGDRLLRPRRARCRSCSGTHVLLPEIALSRRRDEVSVIGAAIVASVGGEGYRRIAGRLGVHADTVRGWLRRFRDRAELIRVFFESPAGTVGDVTGLGGVGRDRRVRAWRAR
jgi:transposase-like protein